MKVSEWLTEAQATLSKARVGTARLDSLVVLEDLLNTNRTHLLAYPDTALTDEQLEVLDGLVGRRSRHEPLAYIRRKTEFYGRSFYIDQRVLVPRPESETIIDMLKHLPLPASSVIADIGTGSGALAVTAALELLEAHSIGIDIDPTCLEVASRNAKAYRADVTCLRGDLAMPLMNLASDTPLILLCNLPYVPDNFPINKAAAYEPRLALFGGGDGLDVYRKLFTQLQVLGRKPEFILTESLPAQHDALARIARGCDFNLRTTQDFVQLFETD